MDFASGGFGGRADSWINAWLAADCDSDIDCLAAACVATGLGNAAAREWQWQQKPGSLARLLDKDGGAGHGLDYVRNLAPPGWG